MTTTEPTHDEARALFPVLRSVAYLNAGTFGPLAEPTVTAMRDQLDADLGRGRSGMPYFERALALREEVRRALGGLVGAEADSIALTASTTEGCNIVLAGLGLGPGDEVVTTTDEHPGLLLPLGASPAKVIVVPPDADAIAAAVSPRTKLVAISQVLWTTGAELPVRAIRDATGVPILVDGAQSVGAIPVDADGLDFLTISGQKWLGGPDTTGALYVADPDGLRVATPSYFSQSGFEPDGTFAPRAGAPRFEASWWPVASLAGLLAAIAVRPTWWHERSRALAREAARLLAERFEVVTPGDTRATIVSARVPDTTRAVERLNAVGVHVRELPGLGLLRASIGWWSNEDDLARLMTALPG